MLRTTLAVLAMSPLSAACHRPPTPMPEPGPVITRLDPASGPAGQSYPLRITIEGAGFATEGNVVQFGDLTVSRLVSESPTMIVFFAPKERPSIGEVPPMILGPGEYQVTVQTPAGTSAGVIFILTRGP